MCRGTFRRAAPSRLNESPSKKEGKSISNFTQAGLIKRLNESPSKKEGKSGLLDSVTRSQL